MFCPKCGTSIPDTSEFCISCGTPVSASAASSQSAASIDSSNYNPAAAKPAPVRSYGTSAKSRGLSKNQYLRTEAPENIKKLAKSTYWIFAVSAILSFVCLFSALTAPFYDLKICQIIDEDMCNKARYEIEEERYELERERRYYEEYDYSYSSYSYGAGSYSYMPSSYRTALMEFYENPSIMNASDYFEAVGVRSNNVAYRILNVVKIVLWTVTIMIVGFAFLAAYLKSTVSSVFTAIFSALFGFMFSTVAFTLLTVASAIALAVVCSKINTAYKA